MPTRPASTPEVGRRVLIRSAALLAGAALAGCGVRLEEDAPDLPLVPRRATMPGESVLLDLLSGTLALARAATVNGSDVGRALELLHRTQATVLQDALRRGGVPSSVVTSTVTAVTDAPKEVSDADLAVRESQAGLDLTRYGVLSPELARPVIALLAQRRAAATLLTPATSPPAAPVWAAPAPTPSVSPSTSPSAAGSGSSATAATPSSMGPALTAALEAVHALEVVQARSPRDAGPTGLRERAGITITWLRGLAEAWTRELGDSAPEAPIAIVLPFPVTSPEDSMRLAAEMLGRLRSALGRHLSTLEGAESRAAWESFPATLSDVEVHAHQWGAPLAAFPGLS